MKFTKKFFLIVLLLFLINGTHTLVAEATITAPSDISNLKLWLDANDVDGDGNAGNNPANGAAVATWTDKSGNSLNATQATGSKQPTYETNSLNSKPTIAFSGNANSQQFSVGASTTNWGFLKDQTGSSVFIVVKSLGSSSSDTTDYILYTSAWQFYNYASGSVFVNDYPHLSTELTFSYNSDSTATIANQYGYNTHSVVLKSSSPAFEYYVEGGIVSRAPVVKLPSTTNPSDTLYIGGSGGTTYPLKGNIAEVIMYTKTVSSTERQDVECYLETKWGLSTNACASAVAPTLTNFTSTTSNATYGVGQAVNISATFSKNMNPSSTMTVVLDTGRSVTLDKVFQNTVYGKYMPNVGESSADLNVSSITSANVTDINGNNVTSLSLPSAGNNLAGQKAIVVATNTSQVPVIIIAGQSNALGRADLALISRSDGTANTKIIDNNLTDFATLQQGVNQHYTNPTTQFGPEMGIGYQYKDETGGAAPNLYIIKVPVGNTFLKPFGSNYQYWDPDTYGGLFDLMVSKSQTAFTKIKTAGFTPNVLGVYWLQGENDAIFQNYADEYQTRLTDFISKTRSRLGFSSLPFAIGKIVSPETGTNTIRAAEAAVVNAGTNTCLINLDDLTMNVDNIHFNAASQMTMGGRVWNAFKDCSHTAPTLTTKVINGSALTLTFSKSLNTTTVPSGSAFTFKINGSTVSLNSLSVSGTQLTATSATAVVPTDTVTLAYAIPGSNPVQDWSANQLAAISSPVSVTNQTPITSLTSVIATPGDTTAAITWNSNASSSSIVDYGLTSSYGTSTVEADTGPRVLNHTVNLSGIPLCTQLHYRVRSIDAFSTTVSSSDAIFTTTGCTGSASVITSTASTITTASGGTVSLGDATLTIPTSYTLSASSAAFQIKELDPTAFFGAVAGPSGVTRAQDYVVNLKALTSPTAVLSTFLTPLTVTISYDPNTLQGVSESSLVIYRYDGSSWTALSNCVVDTSAHTVSCETSNFSEFALYGTIPAATTSTTSRAHPVGRLLTVLPAPVANQVILTIPVAPQFTFVRSLRFKNAGKDVRALQAYLNNHGFMVTTSGTGSKGHETSYFGLSTRAALMRFQKANNIKPFDGIFGPKTRKFVNDN